MTPVKAPWPPTLRPSGSDASVGIARLCRPLQCGCFTRPGISKVPWLDASGQAVSHRARPGPSRPAMRAAARTPRILPWPTPRRPRCAEAGSRGRSRHSESDTEGPRPTHSGHTAGFRVHPFRPAARLALTARGSVPEEGRNPPPPAPPASPPWIAHPHRRTRLNHPWHIAARAHADRAACHTRSPLTARPSIPSHAPPRSRKRRGAPPCPFFFPPTSLLPILQPRRDSSGRVRLVGPRGRVSAPPRRWQNRRRNIAATFPAFYTCPDPPFSGAPWRPASAAKAPALGSDRFEPVIEEAVRFCT